MGGERVPLRQAGRRAPGSGGGVSSARLRTLSQLKAPPATTPDLCVFLEARTSGCTHIFNTSRPLGEGGSRVGG